MNRSRHARSITACGLPVIGALGLGALTLTAALSAQTKPNPAGQPAAAPHKMHAMTDAEFVPMMIQHHRDGIRMAQLEEQKGASAAVKGLARKIRESQERDIQELQRHGKSAASSRSSGAADTTMAVPMERETQRTMSRLQSASGAALDHAFLEEMAKHHEMAISMSQGAKLQDPQLTRLAEKMRQSQQQELGELKQQLTSHGTAK